MKERIRKLRRSLDLTQQEFADRIGMKRNTVANYETGRNDPSASVISLICREFNVNEEWLRTGEGNIFEELTDQQRLSKYTTLLLNDTDSTVAEAIKAFIVTYEQLDIRSKLTLDNILHRFIKNYKENK